MGEKLEKIIEQHGFLFEVEEHGFVPEVVVGNKHDVLGECVMPPCSGGVLDHGDDSLVLLLIDRVQVNSLRPHLVLLACPDQFWNLQFTRVCSNEVHESLRLVLAVSDAKICVDAIVGPLQVHALLE